MLIIMPRVQIIKPRFSLIVISFYFNIFISSGVSINITTLFIWLNCMMIVMGNIFMLSYFYHLIEVSMIFTTISSPTFMKLALKLNLDDWHELYVRLYGHKYRRL